MHRRQIFYILMLFHQADHLRKLKTKEALIQILVELRDLFSSTQKSDHLKNPSFTIFKIIFQQKK